MGIEAKTNQYWIAPSAVTITLNALGNPNRTQGSVASGAVISCYVEEVKPESAGPEYAGNGDGLGLDNGRNPKRWPLSLSPTYFNSNTAKYVYVAIPRKASFSTQAMVVFPSERLDIYGKNAEGAQIGSTDYFYVWLQGVISATDGNVNRTWTANIDFGSLGTYEDIIDMSETDWYQYSKVTGIVTFLKQIVMGDDSKFQNLKALMAVIEQKLTLGSGTTRGELTGVATDDNYESVSEDSDTHIVTPSYLDEFGNTRYLSKVNDDVAQGIITFLKGIKIGQAAQFGIDKDGNATLYDIIFNHILKSSGAAKGIDTGQGIIMDASDGTIEADGFIVRGWAMFRKLIYNYLEIMEQDYQFSGGGDIEEVVDNGNMTYTCYLHKEKEGRHMLSTSIKKLITYGLESGLLPENEVYYATNLLLDCFHEEYYEETDETFANLDMYAFPPTQTERKLTITTTIWDNYYKIVFADNGMPFNPLAVNSTNVTEGIKKQRKKGGLGIYMVKNLADFTSYKFDNKQNILTIELWK